MESLCLVDTSSLIYLSGIKLANKSLHKWLWEEFQVGYSQAVLEEIKRNKQKIDKADRKRKWQKYVIKYATIKTTERVLFKSPLEREFEAGYCHHCRQQIYRSQKLTVNLATSEDRGERHNCCLALHVVMSGQYSQVIFLTDDDRARRYYVSSLFELFPIGKVWSSLDFVLYLFMRYRRHTSLNDVLDIFELLNTRSKGKARDESKTRRLRESREKARQIDRTLSQIKGGH